MAAPSNRNAALPKESAEMPMLDKMIEKDLNPSEVAEMPKPMVKVAATGKINVIATRAGWYKRIRRAVGDKFTIDGQHQMGKWMKVI